jgi:hypothetical protein
MAETLLGGAVTFIGQLGIYDVVLPFLLVFTLIFAFLEKTKILGVEVLKDAKGNEQSFTRKNMNSMVAFTIAFFVIASSQLVRVISEVLANTVILIVLGLSYMLATGIFHTGQEEYEVKGWYKHVLSTIALIGVLLITLNALGWLDKLYYYLQRVWYDVNVAAILMVLFFVGFIVFITWGNTTPPPPKKDGEKKEGKKEGE